jgi:excisionase family DNA binding protein
VQLEKLRGQPAETAAPADLLVLRQAVDRLAGIIADKLAAAAAEQEAKKPTRKGEPAAEEAPASRPGVRLLKTKDLANYPGISLRTLWRAVADGKILAPTATIGSRWRWDRAEVDAWIRAGAPPAKDWRAIRHLHT